LWQKIKIKTPTQFLNKLKNLIPGLILVGFISIIAKLISLQLIIGPIVIVILLGVIIGNGFNFNNKYLDGISFAENRLLNFSIIFMGVNLDVDALKKINYDVLFMLFTLIVSSLIITFILGKIFKLSSNLSLLIGVGNGICGSSAIAGASKIIKSKDEEIALSISIINIIGALSIFFIPYIINYLSINDISNQGIIIGSTVQAVGQVVAAGHILGPEVSETAILIKMVRILFLVPILFLMSLLKTSKIKNGNTIGSIPKFIIGFTIVIVLNNFGFIPQFIVDIFKSFSKLFLLLAMAAIGLKVSIASIFNYGSKVFLVGFISFVMQVCIAIQFVT